MAVILVLTVLIAVILLDAVTTDENSFAIGFEFYQVADVKVYKNGPLLSYDATPTTSSTYSIAGTSNTSD